MAKSFTKTFDHIIALCQTRLENLDILRRQERPQYAILELRGRYQTYLVQIREILRLDGSRKYSYYVLQETRVIAGFDNTPDPGALRLKYGDEYTKHRLEAIPHYHSQNKQITELTGEMDCETFIQWMDRAKPMTNFSLLLSGSG